MGRPRKTSNLGADIRGDTSAPAISTLTTSPQQQQLAQAKAAADKLARPHSKRRKARSVLRRWKQISLRHTWLNPLILILIILALYAWNPSPSNRLHKALFLSYRLPPDHRNGPILYGKGPHDIAFVAFYTIVLSFTREFLMQIFIRPLALRAGMKGRAKTSRFMEQVYTAIYFAFFGPLGIYVMSRGPLWYFNTTAMFEGFPHRTHEGIFKAYYLLQASYWSQQAIVLLLQLEKPRKDFKELVGHHIITLALIGLSYRFHFTYMGLAVYITHDISDFFLATSKTLNYLDSIIVGPYFSFFILVWIYLRHYINFCILWATLTEFRSVGPFQLNWETQQYKCWISQYITFILLASLQAVNLFWLFLILRIAKNYVLTHVGQDERSDDEDDDDEAEEMNGRPTKKNNGLDMEATRNALLGKTDAEMGSDNNSKPIVLVNGELIDHKAKAAAIEEEAKKDR